MFKNLLKAASILMIFSALWGGLDASAQNRAISGQVIDAGKLPVIGAAVMIPGTNTGATTDLDGKFSIQVAPGTTLEVSCIGYATIRVTAAENMVITLEEDNEMLEETVVIGYGTQKKKLLTGSTINITGDDIQKQNTTNALGAIYSSVPGVNIVQSSGVPGASYNITIRGLGTNGNSNPLIVIDGVAGGNLDDLSPADIESIDILKDAASAAIYGARAANGVVLVTTRQGKVGEKKATVTFDAYMGFQQPNTNGVHGVTASVL